MERNTEAYPETRCVLQSGPMAHRQLQSMKIIRESQRESTWNAFSQHIQEGSVLIHDSERSHSILVSDLNLKEQKYNSRDLIRLDDKDNPLREVNHACALLKAFLRSHSGFDRDELQGYLDLFTFLMNPPAEPLEKVKVLLASSLYIPETLRYRDYYSGKSHD